MEYKTRIFVLFVHDDPSLGKVLYLNNGYYILFVGHNSEEMLVRS